MTDRSFDRERIYEAAARVASSLEPAGILTKFRDTKAIQAAAGQLPHVTDADRSADWAQGFTDAEWADYKAYDSGRDRAAEEAHHQEWVELLDAIADLAAAVPLLLEAAS